MSESSRTNIPKFASFRPKPTPPVSDVSQEEKQKRERRGQQPIKADLKDGHRRRHRSRSRERHQNDHVPATKNSVHQLAEETSGLFVIDRKGDVKNLTYGSLHRYDIPQFHRAGAGNVLGISNDVKIDRDHRDEKGIVLLDRRDFISKTREKYVFSRIEKERPRLLKLQPDVEGDMQGAEDDRDFISIEPLKGKKPKGTDDGSGESSASEDDGNNVTNYRSIHGKKKASSRPEDENFRYATDSDSSGSDSGRAIKIDAALRQKGVELSRKVDQFPKDMNAWAALIEHQDALLHSTDRRVTNAEIKSTADIKIHMYEKALGNTTLLKDREMLLSGLMTEGAKIWDLKARSDRWERIARDHIDSIVLWTNYLDFKQSEFSTFRHEEVRKVYTERIKLLVQTLSTASRDKYHLYEQLIYVLLRFTMFIRESGFSELAIAIWQGLLELNFYAPRVDTKNPIDLFRDFWESEVPRIGEQGSLGWSQYVLNPDEAVIPEVVTDEADPASDDLDVFKGWSTAEKARSLSSRNPARTLDEVAEDDPYRVILFSDIEEFLVAIPFKSEDLRDLLINAFFMYCQLPTICIHPAGRGALDTWLRDGLLNGNLLDCDLVWVRSNYLTVNVPSEENAAQDIQTILDTAAPNFATSSTSLFGKLWFRRFKSWRDLYGGDNGPVRYDWLRNILRQLTRTHFNEALAEYYLAFEWANEPGTIKKTAKGLLKEHSSCLRLYNAYAMIEWSKGNKDVAKSVYYAALSMSKSMSEDGGKEAAVLWRSLIWADLEEMDNMTALKHILSIPSATIDNPSETSAATLLKANQYLSSNRDYNISAGHTNHAILYAELLAILEYLTSTSTTEPQSTAQGNITSALSVFTHSSQILMSRNLTSSIAHEKLLQSAARLLFHQARIGPFRPALIRDHLSHFLDIFPHNTIFLSLYTWNESRLRIDARVRSLLSSKILRPENDALSSRLFAIQHEFTTGTTHSVRAAFENAVASTAYKSAAALWRLYILWSCWTTESLEAKEKRKREGDKAKEVWYRAIRSCPWSKELYMLGMTVLREAGIMGYRELKEVGKVMAEKELRIHVDLEERLEDWEAQQKATVARYR